MKLLHSDSKMNIKYISAKFRTERQVRAVTGLSSEQLFLLLPVFEEQLILQQEENKKNKIKPNNGQIGALINTAEKLTFILSYLKCYPTFDQLGFTFNMSGSSAYTWLSKLMPVFIKSLNHFQVLPKTEFKSPEEMREAFSGVNTLIIDATERVIQRPQDDTIQKETFSGKKEKTPIRIQ